MSATKAKKRTAQGPGVSPPGMRALTKEAHIRKKSQDKKSLLEKRKKNSLIKSGTHVPAKVKAKLNFRDRQKAVLSRVRKSRQEPRPEEALWGKERKRASIGEKVGVVVGGGGSARQVGNTARKRRSNQKGWKKPGES